MKQEKATKNHTEKYILLLRIMFFWVKQVYLCFSQFIRMITTE
jgi:hypothetical protein